MDGVVEKELKDGEELDMVEMRDEVMNFLIAVSGLLSLSSRLETEAEKRSSSLCRSFSFRFRSCRERKQPLPRCVGWFDTSLRIRGPRFRGDFGRS